MLRDEKYFYECVDNALAQSLYHPIFLILKITDSPLSTNGHEDMNADCWLLLHECISAWARHMHCDVEWCLQKNNEIHMVIVANRKMLSLDSLAKALLDALKKIPLENFISHEGLSIGPRALQTWLGAALPFSENTSREHVEEMARSALNKTLDEGPGTYGLFMFAPEDLELAFSRQEFILFYQPQYSVDGKTLKGVEALVRWNHPRYGMILPKYFLNVAERSEFIILLGRWILNKACLDGKRWAPLRIGVNVSLKQFFSLGFFDSVCHILQETGMPPERLELELTEDEPVTEFYAMHDIMERIKDLGIRLALDDFSEGWGRVQVLKRLEFDTLKFPSSLVEGIETDAKSLILLQGFVRLGLDLKMYLVVEGVENSKQQRIIQGLGCDTVQGFFYAKPMSATDMDEHFKVKNQALN